jgi:hypothetical protein
MYNPDSLIVANPLNRYAISRRMPLRMNPDGSLDIFVQHESPGRDKQANWLPADAGGFNVTLRMVSPSILDATWQPPAVTKAQRFQTRM